MSLLAVKNVKGLYQSNKVLGAQHKSMSNTSAFQDILATAQQAADSLRLNEQNSLNFSSGTGGDLSEAAIDTAIVSTALEGVNAAMQKFVGIVNDFAKMSL